MKTTYFALFYLSLILVLGCDPNSSEINNVEKPIKYIKSFTNKDPNLAFYNQYFLFENGFLITINRQDNFNNKTYTYDNSGKLISAISDLGYTYEYLYDEENRMILETAKDGSSIFLETSLEYNLETVRVSRTNLQLNITSTYLHYIDSKGRIIKIVNEIENNYDFKTVEYFYDPNGNITKETFKGSSTLEDLINVYSFLDITNPIYIANDKLMNSYYHIFNFSQITIVSLYGVSPFLINRENCVYTKDNSNYPISCNCNDAIWSFEYY